MIYSPDSAYIPHLIDDYRTGCYGEDDQCDHIVCGSCGAMICDGDTYYDLNGSIFCHNCGEDADTAIADAVREEYTFEF